MELMRKNILAKQSMAIDPALQRVQWGIGRGLGNQASLPKSLRYRKYFNISDAPPENKLPNEYHQEIFSTQARPTKLKRGKMAIIRQPFQNAFDMAKMVSIGMPRNVVSQNDTIGAFLVR